MVASRINVWHDISWQDEAACKGMDVNLFYPSFGTNQNAVPPEVRGACTRCPVSAKCLNYALANKERFGVWGGKTPTQRRKIAKERRAA